MTESNFSFVAKSDGSSRQEVAHSSWSIERNSTATVDSAQEFSHGASAQNLVLDELVPQQDDSAMRSQLAEIAANPTGDAAIDAATSTLHGVLSMPVRDHVALAESVHQALQTRLMDVEE